MAAPIETISTSRAFGGEQHVLRHSSTCCACPMTFALFLPETQPETSLPVLWFLSGLTCTHENAMVKAGAQQWAAEHGIALIFPDTSPRGETVADNEGYDLGQGAGFYCDATEAPWAAHYQMRSYLTHELPELLFANYPLDPGRQAICGHSMGGHGALTLALTQPQRFRSVSAFAPICAPTQSAQWGRKQLQAYLGDAPENWENYDASLLMARHGFPGPVLIDIGTEDPFIEHLNPGPLASAMAKRQQPGALRFQKGYDHSYFFIASFMSQHMAFHAEALGAIG